MVDALCTGAPILVNFGVLCDYCACHIALQHLPDIANSSDCVFLLWLSWSGVAAIAAATLCRCKPNFGPLVLLFPTPCFGRILSCWHQRPFKIWNPSHSTRESPTSVFWASHKMLHTSCSLLFFQVKGGFSCNPVEFWPIPLVWAPWFALSVVLSVHFFLLFIIIFYCYNLFSLFSFHYTLAVALHSCLFCCLYD